MSYIASLQRSLAATPSEYSKLPSLGNGLENTRGNALDTHPSALRQGFGSATPKGGYFMPSGNPAVDAAQMARGLRPLTPSTGAPPPTPMTAGMTPTGVATGSPPTPISNLPSPKGIPSGVRVPIPGVALTGSAALIGVGDFANRLSEGQSLGDAAKGASYTTAGSFAGGAIGFALGGPVGLMVGSMLGGALAGAVYDAAFPTTAEIQPPSGPVPYGKALNFPRGIRYRVFSTNNGRTIEGTTYYYQVYGPKTYTSPGGTVPVNAWVFETRNSADPNGLIGAFEIDPNTLEFLDPLPDNKPSTPGADRRSLPRSGTPSSVTVGSPPASVPATSAPGAAKVPGGIGGIPAATIPGTPPENSNRGMNPPAIAPSPRANPISSPGTSPPTPNPLQSPVPGPANKGGTITPTLGGLSGPSPDAMTEKNQPSPEGQTVKMTVKSPAQSLAPTPAAPTPAQTDEDIVKRLQDMDAMLVGLAASIATLLAKPLSPASPIDLNSPEFTNAVATGNCRTTQPGGCLRKEFDEIGGQNKANSDKLDGINAALNAGDALGTAALAAKLDKIDNKLGAQIPNGGISGKLGEILSKFTEVTDLIKDKFDKLWKASGLDRVLAMLTFAASIHNAAMLSRDLSETLIETLESVLRAVQGWMPDFLKSPEGEGLDLQEFFGDKIEELLKSILGADNYTSLKSTWIKSNRILTVGSNMLSSLRGMNSAITDGLEVTAGWVATGFNGLQRDGVVSDKTWPWMNTTPKFKFKQITRFTENLDNLENAASSIQQLAESSIEFTSEANELVESTIELKKLLDEDSAKKDAEETAKQQESESPEIHFTDLFKADDD